MYDSAPTLCNEGNVHIIAPNLCTGSGHHGNTIKCAADQDKLSAKDFEPRVVFTNVETFKEYIKRCFLPSYNTHCGMLSQSVLLYCIHEGHCVFVGRVIKLY